MDLIEVEQLHRELQATITKAVTEFTNRTGLPVCSIQLDVVHAPTIDKKAHGSPYWYTVRVEVCL